jgi:hypothetical protein
MLTVVRDTSRSSDSTNPTSSIHFSTPSLGDHRLFRGGDRPRGVGETVDRWLAVARHEGVERLDEVPGRTVDARPVARVDVPLRPATPALPARRQLELDDALRAERDEHDAVGSLRGGGHEDPGPTARESGLDLLPFRDEDEIHGQLPPRAAERVQRGEQRRLRTFLVDGAATDDRLPETGLVDDRRVPRR